jgi:hypothetical protein
MNSVFSTQRNKIIPMTDPDRPRPRGAEALTSDEVEVRCPSCKGVIGIPCTRCEDGTVSPKEAKRIKMQQEAKDTAKIG